MVSRVHNKNASIPCPCQSGRHYPQCCQALHDGKPAPNAEALMRSRYSAYGLGLEDYLLQTWHPDTRPTALDLNMDKHTKWLGLTVVRAEQTSDTEAIVEFIARYKIGGAKAQRLHEVSRFEYLDRWYYRAAKDS